MSETEDVQSVAESEETSDADSSKPRSEAEDEKEEYEKQEEPGTLKSESTTPPPKSEEPEQKSSSASAAQPPKPSAPASDRNKPGECNNLLPVLVERLRSALELSCSSQSSEDPLPLEDSGIDSEEDLRMWASGLCNSMEQSDRSPKPLDLKFLEDLLLSDIQTALSRLQDTLKRVDINTLTQYSSTLDPTNKLNLLRLISNLVSKLKIPEAASKSSESAVSRAQGAVRRRRANRHTIGVSAEELAHARKWLEEKNQNSGISDSGASLPCKEPEVPPPQHSEASSCKPVQPAQPAEELAFEQVREKHLKDAMNQHQTLNSRSKESPKENGHCDQTMESVPESAMKNDSPIADEEFGQMFSPFYQQPAASKYNKFTAKKSKIKRANTIDIPNYLKLQSESFGQNQNGCLSLRRPINISDKSVSASTNVIPAFQPKTDSDRKFLALINKNNDSVASTPPSNPFKSFNYRQPANEDKNWNSRFSNIKTTFDKPQVSTPEEQVKPQLFSRRTSQSGTSESGEGDGVVVGSLRLPYTPPKQKSGGFTHAPTSPFQRIEKPVRDDGPPFIKSGNLPRTGSMLQAKVKMFNKESTSVAAAVPQIKNKFNKPAETQQPGNITNYKTKKFSEDEHLSYNPVGQAIPNMADAKRSSGAPSIVNAATSKLIMHIDASRGEQFGNKSKYPNTGSSNATLGQGGDKFLPVFDHNTSSQFRNSNANQHQLHNSHSQPRNNSMTNSAAYQAFANKSDGNYMNKPTYNKNLQKSTPIRNDLREATLQHIKPEVPSRNYPPHNNVAVQNVPIQTSIATTQHNYPPQNYHDQSIAYTQECLQNNPKPEYKPVQDYATKDPKIMSNHVSVQTYPVQDTNAAPINIPNNSQNNLGSYPTSNSRTVPNNVAVQTYPVQHPATVNVSNTSHHYPGSYPTNDTNVTKNVSIQTHPVQHSKSIPDDVSNTTENYYSSYNVPYENNSASNSSGFKTIDPVQNYSSEIYQDPPPNYSAQNYHGSNYTNQPNYAAQNYTESNSVHFQSYPGQNYSDANNVLPKSIPENNYSDFNNVLPKGNTGQHFSDFNNAVPKSNPVQNYSSFNNVPPKTKPGPTYSDYNDVHPKSSQGQNYFDSDNCPPNSNPGQADPNFNDHPPESNQPQHYSSFSNVPPQSNPGQNYSDFRDVHPKSNPPQNYPSSTSGPTKSNPAQNYSALNKTPHQNNSGQNYSDFSNTPSRNNPGQNHSDFNGVPRQNNPGPNYSDFNNGFPRNNPTQTYLPQNNAPRQRQPVPSYSNSTDTSLKSYHAQHHPTPQSYPTQKNVEKPLQSYTTELTKVPVADAYKQESAFLEDENITNQDISSDGVVTRYTCAIATVATTPKNPNSPSGTDDPKAKLYNMKISSYPTAPYEQRTASPNIPHGANWFNQRVPAKIEPRRDTRESFDEIQRHNLLQQQMIRQLQSDKSIDVASRRQSFEIPRREDRSSISPSVAFPLNKLNALKHNYEPVIESNNTLEKIHMFEGKQSSIGKQHFKPLNVPRMDKARDFPAPKINVVSPSKAAKSTSPTKYPPTNPSPCDSSDEYLMACANKPSRSIVLSKSESWHQLALTRGHLQPPRASAGSPTKPPKPKSPSSLKLSKQYEAASSGDSIKRMEEKIQRYFHSPTNTTVTESSGSKRESTSKRHFSSKKHQGGLARSHTMPHLYDDKLSLDENTDVEKAFDSLFEETIKTDNRY